MLQWISHPSGMHSTICLFKPLITFRFKDITFHIYWLLLSCWVWACVFMLFYRSNQRSISEGADNHTKECEFIHDFFYGDSIDQFVHFLSYWKSSWLGAQIRGKKCLVIDQKLGGSLSLIIQSSLLKVIILSAAFRFIVFVVFFAVNVLLLSCSYASWTKNITIF